MLTNTIQPIIIRTKSYGLAIVNLKEYSNRRTAIQLIDHSDGSPIAILTVNLPDESLAPGEFFVKTWSENEEIAQDCMNSGLFEDTGKRVATGHVLAQVWRMR